MSWLGLTAPFTNSFRWTPIQHALTLTQTRQLPYNPVCMFWITPRWNTPPTMMSQLMYLFTCLAIRLHPDIMHAHDHTIPVTILSLTIHLQPRICSLPHQATETTLHLAMVSHTAHHMVTAACLQVSSTGTCTFLSRLHDHLIFQLQKQPRDTATSLQFQQLCNFSGALHSHIQYQYPETRSSTKLPPEVVQHSSQQ